MAKKPRSVDVDIKKINGNTTVAGGNVIQTDQEPVVVPGGDNFADVTLRAEDVTGDITVAGGHVITAQTFNARLDELKQQLLAHFAFDPETRGRIVVLAEQLADEAKRAPGQRDPGRARRWLESLQQFALQAGAGAAGQMLGDAFNTFFLS